MRKTAVTAAGLALGVVSMAGIAYAAGPSGPISSHKASVVSVTDDRGGDRHDADDPASHGVSRTAPARTVIVPGPSSARVGDDPAGHDATDDHGSTHSTGHEFGWNARHDSDRHSGHSGSDG